MHFIIDYQNLNKIKKILLIFINGINVDKNKENILLSCDKDCLNIYANNGITSCKLTVDKGNIKIFKSNEVFMNAKIFLSLIDNLKNHEKIEFITREDNLLEIKSKDFICSLVCTKKEEYIYDDFNIENYKLITFKTDELKLINSRFKDFCKLINNTISKNTLLSNINFRKKRELDYYSVTATDCYRIIFAKFKYDSEEEFEFNISPQCLGNVINIFNEDDESVNFYYSDNDFVVKKNDTFLKSKVFLGNYTDFSEWFNIKNTIEFVIKKNVLLSAIDRNLFLSNNFIKTTNFSLDSNVLNIEYKDSEKGFSKEKLEVKNISEQNISFSLNSLFLKQLVKNIPDENVNFCLTDPSKPIVFFGADSDENFKQIILPLKSN